MAQNFSLFQRGRIAETRVLEHFRAKNAQLICRNLPLVFSEIDLVMLSEAHEILLLEVKLIEHDQLPFMKPVNKKQTARLKRMLERWTESTDKSVRLHLVAVNHKLEVLVFEDFLS